MFDAIGAGDDERDGELGGFALGVAHQRRQVHGFTGAIDAAIGEGEGVDGAGGVAAFDAAVGEIEGCDR